MRFDRDQLIFKALCAVDEAVDECNHGPLKPTFALRFALAFLFAVSDGDRTSYDEFWREVGDPRERAYSDHDRSYLRSTYARIAMTGIARGVGVYLGDGTDMQLRNARSRSSAETGG